MVGKLLFYLFINISSHKVFSKRQCSVKTIDFYVALVESLLKLILLFMLVSIKSHIVVMWETKKSLAKCTRHHIRANLLDMSLYVICENVKI